VNPGKEALGTFNSHKELPMYPKAFFEQNPSRAESGLGFVLMPFDPRFQEVYDTIAEVLEGPDLNFRCVRADELFGGGHIIEDILRCIGRAEIIIADVTGKNPNVFYELGIAHMVKDVGKVLILTQSMEDVPFDLRPFRCLVYQQTGPGLRHLRTILAASVKEISAAAYSFSVQNGEQFTFPQRLFGPDRCFHDFEITQIWVTQGAAKFFLKENRYVLGKPAEIVRQDAYGIESGEDIEFAVIPWRLILEETKAQTAHFRVVPK
jgi:hypothetical protein